MLNLQQRKVLLVLEDKAVATFISAALDQAGCRHAVSSCDSSAFFRLQTDHYDLILLDIDDGSPKRLEMLKKLGAVDIPLICLVDRTAGTVPIPGFQYGAEDFLLKPFTVTDLLGRVEIVLSRSTHIDHLLSFQDIEINLPQRQVTQAGRPVRLTPKEFDLLVLLVEHPDVAMSRARILQTVWGYCIAGDTRTVDMHIMQLRKKIDFHQKLKSVIKVGYRLDR